MRPEGVREIVAFTEFQSSSAPEGGCDICIC